MPTVQLDSKAIVDWDTFHSVCATAFGFPDFYGRNMDAFIDCLRYLDEGDGMSRFHLKPGEELEIEFTDWVDFRTRLPEIAQALIETVVFLNNEYAERGKPVEISLVLATITPPWRDRVT